jgi:hypothetical protein
MQHDRLGRTTLSGVNSKFPDLVDPSFRVPIPGLVKTYSIYSSECVSCNPRSALAKPPNLK